MDMDAFYMVSRDKIEVVGKECKLRQINSQVPNPLQTFRAIPSIMYRR